MTMQTRIDDMVREANEDGRRSARMVGILMLALVVSRACMAGVALVYLASL